jgi:hypothetical protein
MTALLAVQWRAFVVAGMVEAQLLGAAEHKLNVDFGVLPLIDGV